MISSSTARIEKRLNKFMTEVRAGFREGSVVTVADVTETIESPDVWNQLRRELEDVGISAAIMEENHEYISAWIKSALKHGLDELSPDDDANARRVSDSAYGGSNLAGSVAVMSVANEEFEATLRRKHTDMPLDETFRMVSVESATPSMKKRAYPRRLIRKLFQKDADIIQAASDGDIERVAKLISLGCNIDVTDQWG